jgi:Protein of unknown function (DUF2865)
MVRSWMRVAARAGSVGRRLVTIMVQSPLWKTLRARLAGTRASGSLITALGIAVALPWLMFSHSEQTKLAEWRKTAPVSASTLPSADEEVIILSGEVQLTEGNKPWDWTEDPKYNAINSKIKPKQRRARSAPEVSLWFDPSPSPRPRRAFVAPTRRAPARTAAPRATVRAALRPPAPQPEVRVSYVPAPVKRYRTLCVRTCDGYYWPISFASTRDEMPDDAAICKSSCGSTTKLYFHDNPGEEVEQMTDLNGGKYSETATAFLYRTAAANPTCRCQADPWEQASLERHAQYAELAKKGKKIVVDKRPGKVPPSEIRRVTTVVYSSERRTAAAEVSLPAPVVVRTLNRQPASLAFARSGPPARVAPKPPRQAAQPRRKARRSASVQIFGLGNAVGFRKSSPPAAAIRTRRRPATNWSNAGIGINDLPKWLR